MKCRKFEYPSALRGQFNAGVLKEVCKTLRNICPYFEYAMFLTNDKINGKFIF